MEELFKARITQAVNRILGKDHGNIGKELMQTYADMMVDTTCEIFAALSTIYEDEEEMKTSIEEFMKVNFKEKDKTVRPKGYKTDSYMVATVPVLIPIEAVAIVDSMDDITLPLVLRQLSGWLMLSILEMKEFEKLGDKMLEQDSERLADTLKNKGWVA